MPVDRGPPPDPPSRVQITVTVVPTAGAHRLHQTRAALGGARRILPVLVALAAAGLVAILVGAPRTHPISSDRPNAAGARAAGTGAVAAAFGYPHRCLSITISPADRDYATAHVDHQGQCARYHGYVNASFHRVDGVWRLVLDEGQLFVPNSLLAPGHAGAGNGAGTGYPLRCLSLAIALHDPRFALSGFDRRLACTHAPDRRGG